MIRLRLITALQNDDGHSKFISGTSCNWTVAQLAARREHFDGSVGDNISNDYSDIYCNTVGILIRSSCTALGLLCFVDQRSSSARSVLGPLRFSLHKSSR
jgi:hypothetical protein